MIKGKGELILIVDDEMAIREIGVDVLEALGYQTLQASDGLEAIETFTANKDEVALIIIDIAMPKLSGIDAIERIRKISPDIKVIFATGYDGDSKIPGSTLSADAIILSKPYDFDKFSQTVRSILDS